MTLNQVVNLGVAVGQNLPYNHVVQAWNAQTGASLPTFPQAVEDYQLLSSPTVADVSDSPGNEVVVGTGLYYLRNFNVAGIEGTGWPKFTGGWIFATPAAGDADGDGDLEVTTLTREGFGFMWDTDRPACGTNDEWWTSRHDEWNTGAYGTDSRPPGTPTQLGANPSGSQIELTWKAPGDDWLCGTAQEYRVLRSSSPIQHPSDGTVVGDFPAGAAGSTESRTVTAGPATSISPSSTGTTPATGDGSPTTSIGYPRPAGRHAAQRIARAGLRRVHGAEPDARTAARRPVLQPAGRAARPRSRSGPPTRTAPQPQSVASAAARRDARATPTRRPTRPTSR